jgi:hypothetical protein
LDLDAALAEKLDEHSIESRVLILDPPGNATPVFLPWVKQLYPLGVQNKDAIRANARGVVLRASVRGVVLREEVDVDFARKPILDLDVYLNRRLLGNQHRAKQVPHADRHRLEGTCHRLLTA